jgi:type IV secretion system protein TrbC
MKKRLVLITILVGLSAVLAPATASAATGGGGLPWETPLTTLGNSITGPVAYGISIIGIVAAGGVLIFMGGQINEFLRAVIFIILVISFIIAAKNTLSAFGWGNAAEITAGPSLGVVYAVKTDPNSPGRN